MIKQLVISALLCGTVAPGAVAQSSGTTEQDIVTAYMKQQRIEQWLDAETQAIQAEREGAALLRNPELEVRYEPMTYADGSEENELAIWLTQSFDAWGARDSRQQAANHKALVEQLRLAAEVRDELVEVKRLFYRLVMLRDHYASAQQWVKQLEKLVDLSNQQLQLNEQSALDHFRLNQALSSAVLQLSTLEQQVISTSKSLNAYTGLTLSNINASLLPSDLAISRLSQLSPPQDTLELKVLESLLKGLDAERAGADAMALPEIALSVGVRQLDTNAGNQSEAAAFLAIELPLFERGQYQSRHYASLKSALEIEQEQTQRRVLQTFASIKQRLKAGIKGLNKAQQESVSEMLDSATEAYWLGEISVTELIDIQQTQMALSEQVLSAKLAIRQDWIALQSLLNQTTEINQ